jgi:hypothetical protein
VTDSNNPRAVPGALVPLADAHKLHVARVYAYVANGSEGVAIIDINRPEQPALYQMFNADGAINDARDVTVASTNASPFLYVADGKNGLRVVQLTSPESQPKFYGYGAEPRPELIATRQTKDPALSLSRALERDRAGDETGHQIAILGRIGARPMNGKEQAKLFLDDNGSPWYVDDLVDGPAGIESTPTSWQPNRIWDVQVSPEHREKAHEDSEHGHAGLYPAVLPALAQPGSTTDSEVAGGGTTSGDLPSVTAPSLQRPRRSEQPQQH